jgi:hypothetical protein
MIDLARSRIYIDIIKYHKYMRNARFPFLLRKILTIDEIDRYSIRIFILLNIFALRPPGFPWFDKLTTGDGHCVANIG